MRNCSENDYGVFSFFSSLLCYNNGIHLMSMGFLFNVFNLLKNNTRNLSSIMLLDGFLKLRVGLRLQIFYRPLNI